MTSQHVECIILASTTMLELKRYNISNISTLKGVFIEWVVLVLVIEKYF
jgi:hypothetical protein